MLAICGAASKRKDQADLLQYANRMRSSNDGQVIHWTSRILNQYGRRDEPSENKQTLCPTQLPYDIISSASSCQTLTVQVWASRLEFVNVLFADQVRWIGFKVLNE